jgi:hypothetical protein
MVPSGNGQVGDSIAIKVGGGEGAGSPSRLYGAGTLEAAVSKAKKEGDAAASQRHGKVEDVVAVEVGGDGGEREFPDEEPAFLKKTAIAIAQEDRHVAGEVIRGSEVEAPVGIEVSGGEGERLATHDRAPTAREVESER